MYSKIIDNYGRRYIAGMIFHQIILLPLLFISAGSVAIFRFWLFILVNLLYMGFELAISKFD